MGTPTPTASPTSPTSSPTAPTSTVSPAPGVGQSLVQNVALTFTQNVASSDWTGNLKNVCDCGYGRTIGSHTSTCSIVSGWTSASTFISRRGINTVRFTSTSETRTAAQLQASADQLVSSSTTMASYITAAGRHGRSHCGPHPITDVCEPGLLERRLHAACCCRRGNRCACSPALSRSQFGAQSNVHPGLLSRGTMPSSIGALAKRNRLTTICHDGMFV